MPTPTVAQILKASGLDDDAIAALDAKVLAGFTGVLTTAEQERKQAEDAAKAAKEAQDLAEVAVRSNKEFYEKDIVPALAGWEDREKTLQSEIANAKALAAFYQEQNKSGRDGGFIPADAPQFAPVAAVVPRSPGGQFVANAPGGTPGSPQFKMEDFESRIGHGLDNSVWALQEYQRLSGGQFLPDSISNLTQEANANKLPFKDYVSKKYDFAGKAAAMQAKAKEAEKAQWLAEATAPLQEQLKAKESEWQKKMDEKVKEVSERGGNNPDVRRAAISKYPEIVKAVEQGTRKDPLSLTKAERQVEMRRQIQADVATNEEVKAGVAA